MDSAVGVGGVGVADGEGVTVVVGVSRGGLMAWVLLVLVLACVWVRRRFRACHSWLVFGRLVVMVVPVVSGVELFPSVVPGSVVAGVASVVVEGAAVGGAGDGVGEGAAGGAVSVGVVGRCR